MNKGKYQLVWRLQRSMYELKQFANLWYRRINEALQHWGFWKLSADSSIFIKKNSFINRITVLLYMNDMKIICKNMHAILAFKENISTKFKISDMRSIDYYLDVKITQNRERRILILSQKDYMKKTLILLEMNETMSASIFKISGKYYEANDQEIFTEESHKYL